MTTPDLSPEQSARLAERSAPRHSDFSEVALPALPAVPGLVSEAECRYLYWLTSWGYAGAGAVVEVGTWLGLSTIHLAAGLRDAGFLSALDCYDQFEWRGDHVRKNVIPLRRGDDFQPYFERKVRPHYPGLRVTRTELRSLVWTGGPIEILFLDAPKHLVDLSWALAALGPSLVPGPSLLVMQDYLHPPAYALPALVSRLGESLRPLHVVRAGSTVGFAVTRRLDFDRAQPIDWNFARWSLAEILDNWARAPPRPRYGDAPSSTSPGGRRSLSRPPDPVPGRRTPGASTESASSGRREAGHPPGTRFCPALAPSRRSDPLDRLSTAARRLAAVVPRCAIVCCTRTRIVVLKDKRSPQSERRCPMRRLALLSLVVLCVLALYSGAEAQRINPGDGADGSGHAPVPVAVSNFPTMQAVTGTVDVRNFPLSVEVTGLVDVGNLPLDAEGNLRVTGLLAPPSESSLRFVGITRATVARSPGEFDAEFPILAMNRACHAEFPRTRSCLYADLLKAIPPPPLWDGFALVAGTFDRTSDAGVCIEASGTVGFCQDPQPVACCGS